MIRSPAATACIFALVSLARAICLPSVVAQNVEIRQVVFLPPEYYVGDEVELRVRFRTGNGPEPEQAAVLPDSSWLEIRRTSVHNLGAEWEVRILFVSYKPGTRTLPVIQFGKVALDGIKSHTSSLLEAENPEFAGYRDQMFLPGTEVILAVLVGILLAGPLAGIGLVRLVRGGLSDFWEQRWRKRPYREFQKEFRDLRRLSGGVDSRSFYYCLSTAFRSYLTKRTVDNYLTVTTRELTDRLGRILPDRGMVSELGTILQHGDEVKFGGKRSSVKKQQSDMEKIGESVEEVESLYRRDYDARKRK